jgi:hypothetical protein
MDLSQRTPKIAFHFENQKTAETRLKVWGGSDSGKQRVSTHIYQKSKVVSFIFLIFIQSHQPEHTAVITYPFPPQHFLVISAHTEGFVRF